MALKILNTCTSCKFIYYPEGFGAEEGMDYGHCHANPPTVVFDRNGAPDSYRPVVRPGDRACRFFDNITRPAMGSTPLRDPYYTGDKEDAPI